RVLVASRAAKRLLDVEPEEVVARGVDALLPDDDARRAFRAMIARAEAGEDVPWTDVTFLRGDGRRNAMRVTLVPVVVGGGVRVVQAIVRDVQAEIDARRKLVEQDRLASIG